MQLPDKYLFLFLRVLSMLVVGELVEDVPYAADVEALRLTILQAYTANAGAIASAPLLRYCRSSAAPMHVLALRSDSTTAVGGRKGVPGTVPSPRRDTLPADQELDTC